ncbi:MAG: hypothetical protein WKG01_28520 [Kofleriaceae bacterium]
MTGSIARSWRAHASVVDAPRYVAHFERLRPELAKIAGFEGALVLLRDNAGGVDITVLTFWESLEAIARFAPDVDRAVVEPEAEAMLEAFDDRVEHYKIASR